MKTGPKKPWQISADRFTGPVLESPVFAIDGRAEEDYELIWDVDTTDLPVLWSGASPAGAYQVRHLVDWEPEGSVVLRAPDGTICGFCLDGQVWIDPPHRGRGLSARLLLASAELMGGSPVRDNDGCPVGFAPAGAAALRAAHRVAVHEAAAAGLPVPSGVLAEYNLAPLGVIAATEEDDDGAADCPVP